MRVSNLEELLRSRRSILTNGPVALVFVEDGVEVRSTLEHHLSLGFATVLAFAQDGMDIGEMPDGAVRVNYPVHNQGAVQTVVNAVIEAAHGSWLYYCYNAEYLYYPFLETRDVVELLAFHSEERREAMLTYVLDLYAPDLSRSPDAVSLDDARLDRAGYYALRRYRGRDSHPMERQLDFFGGLRWRFEEHIPQASRRIDRISLFRAKPGLELRSDHTLNDEEMNTFACPWHNNITAAIASFRTAKALATNPGSRYEIRDFTWQNSTPFEWSSRQLMDLGLMEPGQWF